MVGCIPDPLGLAPRVKEVGRVSRLTPNVCLHRREVGGRPDVSDSGLNPELLFAMSTTPEDQEGIVGVFDIPLRHSQLWGEESVGLHRPRLVACRVKSQAGLGVVLPARWRSVAVSLNAWPRVWQRGTGVWGVAMSATSGGSVL
jgi:hypothetical protein